MPDFHFLASEFLANRWNLQILPSKALDSDLETLPEREGAGSRLSQQCIAAASPTGSVTIRAVCKCPKPFDLRCEQRLGQTKPMIDQDPPHNRHGRGRRHTHAIRKPMKHKTPKQSPKSCTSMICLAKQRINMRTLCANRGISACQLWTWQRAA